MTGKSIVIGGVIALASAGVTAGGVYWWQSGQVDDVEERLQSALDAAAEANDESRMLSEEVREFESRIRALRSRERETEEATHVMQECVLRVSDEDGAGAQEVLFGFLSLSPDSKDEAMVDVAEWYVGDDANREALEDGVIERGDSVPNDYYIRNDDPELISIPLEDDVVVVTTTADRRNIPAPKCKTWNAFVRVFREPQSWQTSVTRSPYWMTVQSGEIVRLVEQYLP